MRARGADVLAFWSEWPMGELWFVDDMNLEVEDSTGPLLEPEKSYDLSDFGVVCWQGPGDPPSGGPAKGENHAPIEDFFRAWKKKRTHASFVVTVPKGEEGEFRRVCREAGWKVS